MHERPASRPAGHRYPGPLDTGLSGTGLVADDLYLIAHDDRTRQAASAAAGAGDRAGRRAADRADAGGVHRPAARQHGRVRRGRDAGHGDAARAAEADSRRARTSAASRRGCGILARSAARDVALRLEQAGYLEHVRSWIPGRQGRWVPVNPDWAFAPMLRVRSALDPARPLTAHAAALTGLAVAGGLRLPPGPVPDPGRPDCPGRRRRARPRLARADLPDPDRGRQHRAVAPHLTPITTLATKECH